MDDITHLTARAMAGKLRRRELTARDVLAAHKARTEAVNGEVNAFVTLDWDAAEAHAAELDAMAAQGRFAGPLHGVPVAIKDVFETKGLRTTWGSRAFENHVPQYDALHVARLRAAGAVITGKSNTPEFAYSGQTANLVSGTTRNPLDTSRSVAGSSGGAAAALAANMVALADGSDLGGSTRTPAAWCGIAGYRPTSGLIPMSPNPVPFDGLSIPGTMSRNLGDLVLMLEVMQGNTPAQPLGFWAEEPSLATLARPVRPGRLAFMAEPFGASVDPSVQAAISPVAQICRSLGWEVEEAAPPLEPLLDFRDITRGLSALGVRAALKPDMALTGESYRTACAQGEGLSLADFTAYQAVRAEVWAATAAFFERYEFALWPTATGRPFSAGLRDGEITEDWRTVTLTPVMELPSISIPCGRDADGMPAGLHITGPKGSDAALLRFAHQIEGALAA